VLLAYLAVWAIGITSLDSGYVGHIADDGIYLVTAQSIRDGHGYRLPSRPGDPIARKYPPGLPAAAAAVMKLMPGGRGLASDVLDARILIAFFAAVFLYLSWLLLMLLKMPPGYALAAVAAVSLHPTVIAYSSSIMSDLMYAALAMATLLVAMSGWKTRGHPTRIFLAAGALAAAAICVRGNGIVLLPALIVQAALAPRRKAAIAASLAGFLLLVLPVTIVVGQARGPQDSASYRNELAAAWSTPQAGIAVMLRNFRSLDEALPPIPLVELWSTPATRIQAHFPRLATAFNLAVCTMLIGGIFALALRPWRPYAGLWVYGALSLATLLVWPWNLGLRLLLPLFPLIVMLFVAGFTQSVRALRLPLAHPARAALAVVAINALASFASYSYHLMHGGNPIVVHEQQQYGDYVAMADLWVPRRGVVINWEPELMSLYSHRQAVPLIEDDDCLMHRYGRWERIESWMDAAPGREFYLVVAPPEPDATDCAGRQVAALLRDHRMQVDVVQSSPHVLVARVSRRSVVRVTN
jgi:hypothetical protein